MAAEQENIVTVLRDHWGVVAGAVGTVLAWSAAVWRVQRRNDERLRDLEEGIRKLTAELVVVTQDVKELVRLHEACVEERRREERRAFERLDGVSGRLERFCGVLEGLVKAFGDWRQG